MSYRHRWLDAVEADPEVGAGERHLANVLVRHFVNENSDMCWPGQRRLAEIMGTGRSTAARRLQLLEHWGYLHSSSRGNGRSHLRRLLLPDWEGLDSWGLDAEAAATRRQQPKPTRRRGGRKSFLTGLPRVPLPESAESDTRLPTVPVRALSGSWRLDCPQSHTGLPSGPEPLLLPLAAVERYLRARPGAPRCSEAIREAPERRGRDWRARATPEQVTFATRDEQEHGFG
jgi:DNA-binding transcriptional MocR family regulator